MGLVSTYGEVRDNVVHVCTFAFQFIRSLGHTRVDQRFGLNFLNKVSRLTSLSAASLRAAIYTLAPFSANAEAINFPMPKRFKHIKCYTTVTAGCLRLACASAGDQSCCSPLRSAGHSGNEVSQCPYQFCL